MKTSSSVLFLIFAALPPMLLSHHPVFSQEEVNPAPPTESSTEGEETAFVEEEIEVLGDWPVMPSVRILDRQELAPVPIGDGADLLRGVAGVTVGRMGGHGLEPRIRGLGEANLNVQVDGAYVHGGCPNRMDPPSSFASPNSFDEVTVIKGVQTMRFGPGGTAGTVIYQRNVPELPESRTWRTEVAASYGSWHQQPELGVDAGWARGGVFLRAQGGVRSFDSYEDGSGETVRSAFDSEHLNLMAGFGKATTGQIELGLEAVRTDDALFAGAGMDSPEDSNDTYRLKFHRAERLVGLTNYKVDLYYSGVDHLMDNYSLRPLTAPMAMRVPSTSDTFGGTASADLVVSTNLVLTIGLDYQENLREALRFAGPNPDSVEVLQSVMWPDASLAQGGLFVEGQQLLGGKSRLVFGGRLDRFSARADKADLKPAGMNRSPNQLYEYYYGLQAGDWSASELSGLFRYERHVAQKLTFFTGMSRSTRAADTTERYLGSNNMAAPNRWVGNPQLEPAKHHQLDLGLASRDESSSWSVTAFLDDVNDFILRDRAHGQEGILRDDNATIYRNVEARLIGLEVEASYRPGERLGISGVASGVRGENRMDDRPIAQIPPLQGWVQIDYGPERWGVQGLLRWAASQTRVDDDPLTGSGQDFGETPGYGVLDISTRYRILRSLDLIAGVDNVFDRTYANHLNRGNLFDPDPVRINEPGRTVWIRLSWLGGAG
jgi:iron complex outermembrane receptor protein